MKSDIDKSTRKSVNPFRIIKKHKFMSIVIAVVLALAVYSVTTIVIRQQKLQADVGKYLASCDFVSSWDISSKYMQNIYNLNISTKTQYRRLSTRERFDEDKAIYDKFTELLISNRILKPRDNDPNFIKNSVFVTLNYDYRADVFEHDSLQQNGKLYTADDLESTSASSDYSTSTSSDSLSLTPSDSDRIFAWVTATHEVEQRLKSPSTAKFPFSEEGQDIKEPSPGTFVVNSYVDAENSYGAMMRSNFSVTIKRLSGDNYTVENLSIQ